MFPITEKDADHVSNIYDAPMPYMLRLTADGITIHGSKVERGPGRHGPGHAMFVYFRDPDGHRVELFNTHYQTMDIENEPVGWDPTDHTVSFPWGMPARAAWFEEATDFAGASVSEPIVKPTPMTLEKYLSKPSH